MRESYTIIKIVKEYNERFKGNWIESLCWKDDTSSQKSYTQGCTTIDEFITFIFVNIGESVLQGEFLRYKYNNLRDFCESYRDDILPDLHNEFKRKLQLNFQQLNDELYDVLNIYRLYIQSFENKLLQSGKNNIVNAISRHSPDFSIERFQALYTIIKACFQEYELSYNEKYIQSLILRKDDLSKFGEKHDNLEIKNIVKIVLFKIDFLLKKLSHLSPNNTIEYFLDFKQQSIQVTTPSNIEHELDSYFQYFLKPDTIPHDRVSEWQLLCQRKEARIWQLVLLMRHYTQVTKSKNQINNLLSHYQELHNKLLQKEWCLFDKYALRTIKNYMYNSRFSFITKDKNSTYQEVVDSLNKIIDLQSETQIHNFHPYKKAVIYFVSHIRTCIQKEENLSSIKEKEVYLSKTIMPKLEDSFKWCQQNQFYPFQLMRNDCKVRIKELSMMLFSPSSFSRPIRYEQLSEAIMSLKMDVISLGNEIRLYEEHKKTLAIKEELEKSKRTQVEILGIFAALLTFFIGCLTIFTNANKNVSIIETIKHISYLGIILLLFISTGYFFVTDKPKKWKAIFFGSMILLYTSILVKVFFIS